MIDEDEVSPEEARQQLVDYAALGREIASFWGSSVGKYLLMRSDKEFAGYQFPSAYAPALESKEIGIKVVRFLYHSKSASGEGVKSRDVPASGVILVPYGKAPAGGWPVVVWGHGTSGVGRPCAPSNMRDLYYSWEGLLQWVMLGYAVVAPDYAGLGTDVRHQYLTPPAQAQDIITALCQILQALFACCSRLFHLYDGQSGVWHLLFNEA